MRLELSDADRARLEGAEGPALRLAMGIIVRAGEVLGRFRWSRSHRTISAASAPAIASPSRGPAA